MTVTLQEIALDQIRRSRHNPRIFRDEDPALAELAESIRQVGVLHPVLVRSIERAPTGAGGLPTDPAFELIAGERRWRAAKLAGIAAIPATVRADLTDEQALELTVTENLQRENLHPLEEANGVAALLGAGHDVAAVADRLGKSLGWVARRARLAKLSATWTKLATNPKSAISEWPAGMLELVARLDPKAQDAFWQEHQWMGSKDRPVGASELGRRLADWTLDLSLAPWRLDDATLDPQAGACATCPKRSSCTPGLFDDDLAPKKARSGDRCLDATCWERKEERNLARVASDLKEKHPTLVFGGRPDYGKKAPAFTKGATLVEPWAGDVAKKGDKGAVPVLYVTGEKRGTVEWKRFGRDAGAKAKKAAAGGKPAVKSLAERRKALEARRHAYALEAICEAVRQSAPQSQKSVMLMAAAFGTIGKGDRPGQDYSGSGFDKPTRTLAFDDEKAAARLWSAVAEVISKRWHNFHRWHGLRGIAAAQPEIAIVAELIGLDLAPFAAAAATAIPEPKSWAKLAEAERAAKKATKKTKRGEKA